MCVYHCVCLCGFFVCVIVCVGEFVCICVFTIVYVYVGFVCV